MQREHVVGCPALRSGVRCVCQIDSKPSVTVMIQALRVIADAKPEHWPDENLRTFIGEMQHVAQIALGGKR